MYIIATTGPSIQDRTVLKNIIENGVNVIRFNFIHGNSEEFGEFKAKTLKINENVKFMLDVSGSKLRISNKFPYIYKVYDGEEIYFCGEDSYHKIRKVLDKQNKKLIPLNMHNKDLCDKDYKSITIKDNTMVFKPIGKCTGALKAKVIKGGVLRRGKGCNIKGFDRSSITLSENDKTAIKWGISNGIDIICESFVEDAEYIKTIKQYIDEHKQPDQKIKLWSKVETAKGVQNIEEIIKESDGVVIGRGDLVPETSLEEVPVLENEAIKIIKKYKNKDLIIATHIFNSMKKGKIPNLAEVESVYSFVKKGVDGFLLAGETSIGKAPVRTVKFLDDLIKKYSKL